ncbi:MAG: ferredoxin [Nocardioidaceae bacterium]|nr:ferredoxin [Nocardioidaceae bacterium]
MRVDVDMTKCQAYGLCAEEAPEVFELDEWGYPVIADHDVPEGQGPGVLRAVAACPAQAIKTTD